MDKTVRMQDAAGRATAIVTDVLEGRMDQARPTFNAEVLEKFTDEVRVEPWPGRRAGRRLRGLRRAAPFVRRVGDLTVVDIPLRYEAGDMKARVAFDADEKVAGLFILVPDAP